MSKSQAQIQTSLRSTEPRATLFGPVAVRRSTQLHIQALSELINVALDQLENLQNESKYSDDEPCLNLRDEVRRFEIDLIQRALTRTHGSQVEAARLLGLNATTLNAKLKRYCLQFPYLIHPATSLLNRPNKESCEREFPKRNVSD